jgi:protein TonB
VSSSLPLPLVTDRADLPPAARRALVAGVLGAHLALAWGLLQVPVVRDTASQVAPLMVDLIAPPAPAAPPPAAPKIVKPPPTLVTSAPTPAPAPPAFIAPAPPVEPAPPAVEAPAAPPFPPAPAPPSRSIPATAVQYLDPPAPAYPAMSRRLGESGQVLVRVEIDPHGRASQVRLLRSSGHSRLDESALAAVRAARFKPYTENGVPFAVWTTVPIVFELEN